MCPVCLGRGEVSAGVTTGVKEYGPVYMGKDWRGRDIPTRAAFPTRVEPNPDALYPADRYTKAGTIWFLKRNPYVELWGIAVCARCRGTGQG